MSLAGVWTATVAPSDDLDDKIRAYILNNPEIIVEALTILAEREAKAATAAEVANFPELFEGIGFHGIGDPAAKTRIVEFFDYKCVPCKEMHPRLEEFVAAHPDTRIEMMHLPILTPGSERAARFALAVREVAGTEAYSWVHDRLWEMRGPLNSAGFARIADEGGLDFDRIEPMMESDEITAHINRNRDIAIALEILGTPAFVTPDSIHFGRAEIDDLAELWLNR